ncbi:MAG: hypothetical protein IT427_07835 [Pirellulales bacterium]|nr:hypothetical protein [Pirellulales bacterium]
MAFRKKEPPPIAPFGFSPTPAKPGTKGPVQPAAKTRVVPPAVAPEQPAQPFVPATPAEAEVRPSAEPVKLVIPKAPAPLSPAAKATIQPPKTIPVAPVVQVPVNEEAIRVAPPARTTPSVVRPIYEPDNVIEESSTAAATIPSKPKWLLISIALVIWLVFMVVWMIFFPKWQGQDKERMKKERLKQRAAQSATANPAGSSKPAGKQ